MAKLRWQPLKRTVRRTVLAVFRHPVEFALTMLFQSLVSVLPTELGTGLGGRLARTIGPRISRSDIARKNLRRCFPEWGDAHVEKVVVEMWEHLGRTVFEYGALARFRPNADAPDDTAAGAERVEIRGLKHLDALKAGDKPGIVFSAHLGNWELITLTLASRRLDPLNLVYRPANNALLNWHIRNLQKGADIRLIQKGPAGAKQILGAMKRAGHVIMLVDQRMNDGIEVPFFGRPAMTAPAVVQLANRFDSPVIPVQVIRLRDANGRLAARHRVIVHPPMRLPDTGDRRGDLAAGMERINAMLEGWIREHPEQWLWIHRRWGKHE